MEKSSEMTYPSPKTTDMKTAISMPHADVQSALLVSSLTWPHLSLQCQVRPAGGQSPRDHCLALLYALMSQHKQSTSWRLDSIGDFCTDGDASCCDSAVHSIFQAV